MTSNEPLALFHPPIPYHPMDVDHMPAREALEIAKAVLMQTPERHVQPEIAKAAKFIQMILDQRGMDAFENGVDELPEFVDMVIFG